MDAEVSDKLEELEARIVVLESVLGDMEECARLDPIVQQHREFVARIRAKKVSA